ncbi:MAG: ATP-binding protein, partial [Candidatus Methylomirabilis sp.]|nr:ATP-binding protein [Deltaproteobacteria bacterium]
VNTHRGVAQEVRLSADLPYMNRHCYVFGGSGRGKSTALRALIAAHLEAGDGFGLIDPHGKLAREARAMVEAAGHGARLRYLHPVRSPIPFNVLTHDGTDAARAQIKADLLDFFAQVSGTAPGVNIAMVLDAALDVLLNRADSTLDDLYAIVSDGPAREEMLERLGTADDRRRWANEILPVLKKGGAQIVTNKLAILRTPLLRPICSSRANAIDFRAILDGRLILLVDFGGIDSKTAAALGRLLTGKLAVSAMTRTHPVPPWYGYIDEFQTMTTPSMVAILQGARKAGLHLTLANQRYFDLPADIAGALSNCYTTLCLGTDDDRDLGLFAKRFEGSFTRHDLRALGRGSGLMLVGARAFNIEVPNVPAPPLPPDDEPPGRMEVAAPEEPTETASEPLASPPRADAAEDDDFFV